MADDAAAPAVDFDPSTAAPFEGDFDPSTASPVESSHVPAGAEAAALTHGERFSPIHPVASMLYPEVDFDTGLPFFDRTNMGLADNFEEKKTYLENVYGKKNVSTEKDPFGGPMLVVVRDGKKVAAEGGEGYENFIAHAIAATPEWLGAAAGGTLGSVEPGGGTVAGAALGGAIGKQAMNLEKQLMGFARQGPAEAVTRAGTSLLENATGQMGGELAHAGLSRLLRGPLPQFITQSTPESQAFSEHLLDSGARPHAQATMPGAKHLQFIETRAEKLVGPVKGQQEANTAFIRSRVRQIMGDAGLSDEQADAIARDLEAGDSKVPTEEVGEHIRKRVQAHKDMLAGSVDKRLTEVDSAANDALKHLDALTRRYEPGQLGVDVAQGIQQARAEFGTAMGKAYSRVDQLVGDAPLVPTQLIRQEAGRLGRRLPKSAQSATTHELAGVGGQPPPPEVPEDVALLREFGIELPPAANGKISFADAQRIRTVLRERAANGDMTRGVTAGEAQHLANMVDYSIQAAGKDPAAASAVKLLNKADQVYAKGIRRFDDATITRLVRDARAGLPPDPEQVAAVVLKPGNEARVKEIRKMVGEDVWKRVASADYQRMLSAATDEEGRIDGARLLREVRVRGKNMGLTFGDNQGKQIEDVALALAARDAKVPVTALSPGRLRETVEALNAAKESEDLFMKGSALSTLANPKRNPEAVYRWLVKPENGAFLQQAVDLLGENSPQLTGLRQAALRELLAQAKFSSADGKVADGLSKALQGFTEQQKKVLFPNGMDDDLHLLGREIEALTVSLRDDSMAGMSAGNIQGKPFFWRVPVQITNGIYQYVLSSPKVIRYLALGLHKIPPYPGPDASVAAKALWNARVETRAAARGTLDSLIRYGAISPSVASNEGAPDEQGDTTQPGVDDSQNTAVAAAGG